jgi:iron complex transport system substrate-binding protein
LKNMSRKHLLLLIVGLLVVVAAALRVRSQLRSASLVVTSAPATTQPAIAIPVPPDYVFHPQVTPEEANAGPRRIISLAPSITEIVCALGMRDRLAGRTRYCQYPPGLEKVPTVGILAESNYGMVKALQPDLVLTTSNSGETVANLTRLGLHVESVPHEGLPGVHAAIARIGQLCGRPRTAAALSTAIANDIDRMRASARALRVPPKRVIVLFGELPVPPKAVFVAGPGLFLDTLIEYAGHHNAAREVLKSSQGEIPLEMLRVLDPDVILEFREHLDLMVMADVYRAWSQVGDLKAIRNQRVRLVGGPEWLSAGPRMAVELHRFISVLAEAP